MVVSCEKDARVSKTSFFRLLRNVVVVVRWQTESMKKREDLNNLVSRHLGEGLIQLVGDGLELFLLMDQFIFEPVNLLLQLLY